MIGHYKHIGPGSLFDLKGRLPCGTFMQRNDRDFLESTSKERIGDRFERLPPSAQRLVNCRRVEPEPAAQPMPEMVVGEGEPLVINPEESRALKPEREIILGDALLGQKRKCFAEPSEAQANRSRLPPVRNCD